jgi:hypothetical protein
MATVMVIVVLHVLRPYGAMNAFELGYCPALPEPRVLSPA